MTKYILSVVLLFSIVEPLLAQESRLVPVESQIYEQAEEYFINNGVVPPYEELPLAAQELIDQLGRLKESISVEQATAVYQFIETYLPPSPFFSPVLETGLAAGINTETGRFSSVVLFDGMEPTTIPVDPHDAVETGHTIIHYDPLYEVAGLPSMLTVGFLMQYGGFSGYFAPTFRENQYGLLEDWDLISIPENFNQLDIANTPLRGIANYFQPPFDLRLGRDKLHSGPGKYSTLTLSGTMPYFDYTRARFFHEWLSLSVTVCSLNPVISELESNYLDYLYENDLNPDLNGPANGKIFRDRIKNYIVANLVLRPLPWLSFSIKQTNLVGGRGLDIADFNPFIIFHNNWDDGTYSVPLSLSTVIVPFKGFKLYAEYLFFDAAVGDETAGDSNPGASAYMLGFSLLSQPFFDAGPGRFRLDVEATYSDPYTWNDFYNLSRFTSRIMYLDPGAGRYWVDYPLGFYLGPDCLDIHASLSYGRPGIWEAELEWQTTGQGEVDLYGYGDDSNFFNAESTAFGLSGTVEWTHSFQIGGYIYLAKNLQISAWYRISFVYNKLDTATRTHITGENAIYHHIGASINWKIY